MHFLSMQGIFLNQLILRLGKLNILNLTQRKESCNAYLHVCSRPSDFSHEISQKFSRLLYTSQHDLHDAIKKCNMISIQNM
jgi:hypothetical protein